MQQPYLDLPRFRSQRLQLGQHRNNCGARVDTQYRILDARMLRLALGVLAILHCSRPGEDFKNGSQNAYEHTTDVKKAWERGLRRGHAARPVKSICPTPSLAVVYFETGASGGRTQDCGLPTMQILFVRCANDVLASCPLDRTFSFDSSWTQRNTMHGVSSLPVTGGSSFAKFDTCSLFMPTNTWAKASRAASMVVLPMFFVSWEQFVSKRCARVRGE